MLLRRRRQLVVALAALLVVGGGGAGAWALTRSDDDAATTAATTQLVAASTDTISQTVSTTGTVQPARRADLSFGVSGTVERVKAVVGRHVAAGAVLATLDATAQESAVDTAEAAVTAARQQVSAAAGSSATQRAAASAQLAQARAQLDSAEDDRDAATLTSPIAGVVASVDVAVGDTAGASSGSSSSGSAAGGGGAAAATSTSSSSAVTVISTDAWVVEASVGSSDLAQLEKGLQAQITPTGSSTRVFGTVASVGVVASTSTSSTTGTATFPVVIDVTGSPTGLYAGSSASVVITVSQLDGVLTVPTQALSTEDGHTVVHQQVDGRQVSTPVTVGRAFGATTEVTDGLAAGDQVVVTNTRPGGGATRTGTGGTGGTGGTQGGGTGQFPAGGTGGGAPAGGFPGGAGGFQGGGQ